MRNDTLHTSHTPHTQTHTTHTQHTHNTHHTCFISNVEFRAWEERRDENVSLKNLHIANKC